MGWKQTSAFGWPPGSVRALLAVLIFSGICWWLARQPEQEVPNYLSNLLFVIMGHYFAARANQEPSPESEKVPAPLWLPKGSIRTLLIGLFVATGWYLIYTHQIIQGKQLTSSGVTLILVLGFLLGVLRAKLFTRSNRMLEDVRAVAALLAGVGLLALTFGAYRIENDAVKQFLVHFRTEDVLAGVVGFYFGSKS